MRLISRAALVAAASIPLAVAAPALASAAAASDVTYSFTVNGSTVTNSITNSSGTPLTCLTALAPAPGGVLPPIADVIGPGQSLAAQGEIQTGTSMQSVTDVPDGSYVVLASCGRYDTDPAMWVSAYPGVEEYLTQFPVTAFTVQQESTVVTIPHPDPAGPDLGAIFGS
ncbi:hypothetical protein [Rhodococcus daqingensis]|uniref:Secreted protein n=1 Tax=Rhodococcus daqingensis TaxID=2479363 RepID=A0ABW2S2P2_9NOCA